MAAGMDDFITKPVRLEAIGAVLERWVTRAPEAERGGCAGRGWPGVRAPRSSPAMPQAMRLAAVRSADDPLDRAQIELLLSLDDGQGEALAEIVNEYIRRGHRGARRASP